MDEAMPVMCSCPLCAGGGMGDSQFAGDGLSGLSGTKPVWSLEQIVANLTRPNSRWGPVDVPYTFYQAAPAHLAGQSDWSGFVSFSPQQREATRLALSLIEDVANIRFVEVPDDGSKPSASNPRLTFSTSLSTAQHFTAYALTEASDGLELGQRHRIEHAELMFNAHRWADTTVGDRPFYVLMHEILHGLGVPHPGKYNNTGGQAITYATHAEYAQDSHQFTVMSYFAASATGANFTAFPQTPMLHDVAALQALYGANTSTRAGDTVYGYGSTAGRSMFDFATNTAPVFSIWDGGGNDTLDFSGTAQAVRADLGEGMFTDAFGMTNNIAIAFGAVLENAVGGSAADRITGNAAGNLLEGRGGDDVLEGLRGDDVLFGGAGADRLEGGDGADALRGGPGDDVLEGGADDDDLVGDEGVDALLGGVGRDQLRGNDGADALRGGPGDDVLDGGADDDDLVGDEGVDTLIGGAGRDHLRGNDGADALRGGLGDDLLDGGADDDDLVGDAGADVLFGGLGADTLRGEEGADQLRGGAGRDLLDGGADDDDLVGDEGDDVLFGSLGSDVLRGNDGADQLRGGIGDDLLEGGAGDDDLVGDEGKDVLFGSLGSDAVRGNDGADQLRGGVGDDLLDGGADDDDLVGDEGDDVLFGSLGSDALRGNDGADQLRGGVGDDLLDGGADDDDLVGDEGGDVLFGSLGSDTLRGNDGADQLRGGVGDDLLDGGAGEDDLVGDEGKDVLFGGGGNDQLAGNDGDDVLFGEAGDDLFLFQAGFGHDIIQDFTAGAGSEDRVQFRGVFTSFEQVMSNATQAGSDVVIAVDASNRLTLKNVTLAQLHQHDFSFTGTGGAPLAGEMERSAAPEPFEVARVLEEQDASAVVDAADDVPASPTEHGPFRYIFLLAADGDGSGFPPPPQHGSDGGWLL